MERQTEPKSGENQRDFIDGRQTYAELPQQLVGYGHCPETALLARHQLLADNAATALPIAGNQSRAF
jgi:hypothetical protein